MESGITKKNTTGKAIVISFRVTNEQAAIIDEAAKNLKNRRSRSDWSRAVVLHQSKQKVPYPVKPRNFRKRNKPSADIETLARILGQLGKIGSNVNQLTRAYNRTGNPPEGDILVDISNNILSIKKQIQNKLG